MIDVIWTPTLESLIPWYSSESGFPSAPSSQKKADWHEGPLKNCPGQAHAPSGFDSRHWPSGHVRVRPGSTLTDRRTKKGRRRAEEEDSIVERKNRIDRSTGQVFSDRPFFVVFVVLNGLLLFPCISIAFYRVHDGK